MAAKLEQLGREFGQNGHPVVGRLLSLEGKVLGWLGVPKFFSENGKKPEKTTLETEWQRQANRLIKLGFHNELHLTEQAYLASLPKFEFQPKEFKGRLDTPLLVETRIPIERQAELAGIGYLLKGLNKGDWPEDPQNYQTPKLPYATWTDEGARFMDRKVVDVRRELALDERGGTEFDGVALYIAKPDILKKRFLDLPGTAVESDRAAALALWDGQPELDSDFVGHANPKFGSLVCGRQK